MDKIDLFLKKTKKDFEDQMKAYKQKLTKLANKQVDYAFLKSLMEEVANGDELEIVVELDGATMTIRKQSKEAPVNKPKWE